MRRPRTRDGVGLLHIERSKTDQAGEGAYMLIIPDSQTALEERRQDAETRADDDPVLWL